MIHLKNSISHLGLTCIRQIHFEWWSQKLYNTRSYLCLPHSSESAKIQPQLAVTGRADESKTLLQKVYWSTNHKPSNLAVVNHCLLWIRWLSWRFRLKRAIVLSDIHFTASVHVINLNTLSLYPSCPFNKVSMCVHACGLTYATFWGTHQLFGENWCNWGQNLCPQFGKHWLSVQPFR